MENVHLIDRLRLKNYKRQYDVKASYELYGMQYWVCSVLYFLFYLMHHSTYSLLVEIIHIEVQVPRSVNRGAEC